MPDPTPTSHPPVPDRSLTPPAAPPPRWRLRLSLVLPPLLVAGLLAVVFANYQEGSGRVPMRARLRTFWAPQVRTPLAQREVVTEIDRFLRDYGTLPEDRWFAALTYLKVGEVERATDAIFGDPHLAGARDTGWRFGDLVLRTLGFEDHDRLAGPRQGAHLATLALAEGGDPLALEQLDRLVATESFAAVSTLYFGALLRGTATALERMVRAFRERDEHEFRVAAALASARAETYPEREEDLRIVRGIARGAGRREHGMRWVAACSALGRARDPEGLEILRATLARLAPQTDPVGVEDRALAAVGLIAAGHWDVEDIVRALIDPEMLDGRMASSRVVAWYVAAVAHRYAEGDPVAPGRIRILWGDAPRMGVAEIRSRLATALFLREEVLAKDDVPVDEFLADLDEAQATLPHKAVGRAYRLRRGDAGAREGIVDLLLAVTREGRGEDAGLEDPNITSPLLTAARALYLYDR